MSHEQSAAESSTVMAQRRWSSFVSILPDYIVRPPNLRQRPLRDGLYLMGSGPTRVQPFFCITITVVPDNENTLCFTMLFFKLGTLISQQNNRPTVPLTNKGKKATTGTSLYISPDISQMANKFFKTGQWISCNSFLTQHIINYCGGDVDPFII